MDRITPTIDFAAELTDLFDMRDKVVFMPGGYGGIGEVIAWALALAGAHVTIAGRDAGKAQALAGALVEHGLKADGIALDVDLSSVDPGRRRQRSRAPRAHRRAGQLRRDTARGATA